MALFNRRHELAPEPPIEYIAAGDDIAVICSDFPDQVVRGFIVRWSDNPLIAWALVQVWYFDEWAGEYRQLFTWESIENMRRLDCFLAEGRHLEQAIIYKEETTTVAAAS